MTDLRIHTIWNALHEYHDHVLAYHFEPKDIDRIWGCICECMDSIEEDLHRLKGLEK